MIVESLSGRLVQGRVERIVPELSALSPLVFGKNLRLGRGEHAIKTAQHRHR